MLPSSARKWFVPLATCWASRGHSCRHPFSPMARAIFCLASQLLVAWHRVSPTRALALRPVKCARSPVLEFEVTTSTSIVMFLFRALALLSGWVVSSISPSFCLFHFCFILSLFLFVFLLLFCFCFCFCLFRILSSNVFLLLTYVCCACRTQY